MHGLADSLDPDSAYLTADQVKQVESGAALPAGDVGLELTRQYYLRVIAARDGSPAAKAGLRTGDYVRAIDDKPTREMSVFEGMRALRGAPGSKVTLTIIRGNADRPARRRADARSRAGLRRHSRIAAPGVGYLRVAAIGAEHRRPGEDADRRLDEERRRDADRRRPPDAPAGRSTTAWRSRGCSSARARWRCARRKGATRETIAAGAGDGAITLPTSLLVDTGTSGAAELFASALVRQQARRARSASTRSAAPRMQKLIKLPDGSGLWLTDDPLPHARRHAAAREGPRADRRRRRAGRRVRPDAADRPIPILDKALEQRRRRRRPRKRRRSFRSAVIWYTDRSSNACIFKM